MPRTADARPGGIRELLAERLGGELRNLTGAASERLVSAATERIGSATSRLTEYADGSGPGRAAAAAGARKLAEGHSPVRAGLSASLAAGKEQLKAAFGKGGKGGSNKVKVTNIVESIDVGVPVRVAYNQWTRYEDFPRFTKKVEHVERTSDEKLTWKAQIFWSHRSWEATVLEQVPDERIVWRSSGKKGHVDGTVTFHALTPDLTRILLVLEYHPQGLFERTGNLWRAQGRRARLELKHFARHVMTQTILRPDEVEGSRVEIHDGRVVRREQPDRARGRDSDQDRKPAPDRERKQRSDRRREQEQESDRRREQEQESDRRRGQEQESDRAREQESDQDQERGTGERARTNRRGRR